MSWKPLPIGVDNFENLIRNGYYFADKTLFIRELLDMKGEVNLFTRPRRFGKTLNMSMLRCFFEKSGEDPAVLFSGTKILEAGEQYLSHMGRYPVISLSLKSMKQPSLELSLAMLKKAVGAEFSRHWQAVHDSGKLTGAALERYVRLRDLNGSDADYADALKYLSECLHACFGEKAMILIDEYDVPLENAWFHGFYDDVLFPVRSLFESALKTNDNLAFAVVTGCLRISRESIFTGLNNLRILSVTDDSCSEYFGFTQQDVDQMLAFYDLSDRTETVKQWYDGYCFGNTEVYNPWSVINFVSSCRRNRNALPRPYWSNTSSNDIVRILVEKSDLSVRREIETLIEGSSITKPVHEDITYEDMQSTQDNLWNFLFFTGYLKKLREFQEEENIYIEMTIPNREVRYIYKNTVLHWFEEKTEKKELSPLYESILNGDAGKMAEILSENLMETISFYDYQESYYHGFLAGMLKNIGNYIVLSNREAGNGRPDIVLKYPSIRGKAVIIEIKVAGSWKELKKKCTEALKQIEEKDYEAELRREGYQNIMKYGVAFYKKECMVKSG
ncbi:MAG TPA: ATP-binding protein [Candidatus Eisenbergiella pullistercoris]|uniref:ATP-binding protein n=1 Tax=Candidatus Eisenbergiella pullistercoris TaxID=2838555 RepID=A0A9D2C4U6_9FIRM|nr:ATP-binding protein [Candidatus Eisenbergiella pullistercoris]